ncbi:TetR/AcrR family transcriptional regulator [Paenibacillus sp. CAU 1782]
MTAGRIREVALKHFAEHGYEGASLANIAGEVGIKKQSIYTHFAGKDDLFLDVFREARDKQIRFVQDYFLNKDQQQLKALLFGFLKGFFLRYEQDDSAKFFLRSIFFPPSHMKDMVVEQGNEFVQGLEEMIYPLFQEAARGGIVDGALPARAAGIAYAALLDAMLVELLYAGAERGMERLEASWLVFWRGVAAAK